MNRLKWQKYDNLIIENQGKSYQTIYVLIQNRAKHLKDKLFLENYSFQKLKWHIAEMYKNGKLSKIEKIQKQEKNKIEKSENLNEILLNFEKENIKKQKQNAYLKKNFREELTISSVRNSIIESLQEKIKNKNNVEINTNLFDFYTKKKEKDNNFILEHILTDIHLNEIVTRKNNVNNWSTEIGLKDIEKIINLLIEKQNGSFNQINLLFLGDLIGTTIHEGLELDIEPIRASSFLASGIAQAYYELKKHFKKVNIIILPGNHSETRKYGGKVDTFNENYDFIVGEKLKEFLILTGDEKDVISTTRDIPLIAQKIGNFNHVYVHGDRFGNNLKNILSIMEEYYNLNYIDYLHEGHFHTEKVRIEDDSLKTTYPCLCQPSTYGLNRIGVTSREAQVGNIYNENGELIKSYSINIDNENPKIKNFNIKFNLDNDLSEIFKITFDEINKKKN